jgi:hypothetical protein
MMSNELMSSSNPNFITHQLIKRATLTTTANNQRKKKRKEERATMHC